jgi:hypothetical protein
VPTFDEKIAPGRVLDRAATARQKRLTSSKAG